MDQENTRLGSIPTLSALIETLTELELALGMPGNFFSWSDRTGWYLDKE